MVAARDAAAPVVREPLSVATVDDADGGALDDDSATVAAHESAASVVFDNPDLGERILSYFRTHYLPDTPWHQVPVDVTQIQCTQGFTHEAFFESTETLACIVSFATCSRATRATALGDTVWAPFCKTTEAQFPSDCDDYEEELRQRVYYTDRPLLDKYIDPRMLDPGYALLSAFERYKAVRAFYKRVRAELMTFMDERSWSEEDRQTLEGQARWAMECLIEEVRERFDIDDAEYNRCLLLCTANECAACVVEVYALRDLAEGNVHGHARRLLQLGWQHTRFGDSSYAACFLGSLLGLETRDGEQVWDIMNHY